jgi:large subunit ribosomal protein L21
VYAIIQAGGRQVRVTPGATVELDGRAAEAGKEVAFEQVLLLAKDGGEIMAGAPFVSGAKVLGIVDGESRGPKVRIFKKKRRKGFRKSAGHRAFFTRVRITDIQV